MKLLRGLLAAALATVFSTTILRADNRGVYDGEPLVQVAFDHLIPTFRPTLHVTFDALRPTTFPLINPGIADVPITENLVQTSEQPLLLTN